MSPSSPPAAGNNVRQQLDELDALLQRMLALPINQLDETAPAPEPAAPRRAAEPPAAPPPAAPAAPATNGRRPQPMVLLADSGPVTPPAAAPENWDQGWAINLNPQHGSSVLGPRSPAAGAIRPPAPEAVPAATPVWRAETVTYTRPAAPVRPQGQVAAAAPATPAAPEPVALPRPKYRPTLPPPAPPLLLPLVWLNRAFDGVVIQFGAPGRWLRSPLGRAALGGSGLLMLVGGAAWGVLDWIGWTW